VTETVALAAQIEAKHPDLSEADVAQQLGITPARLREVRRQVRQLEQDHGLELAA
jgi:predicted transcriptional regulator